MALRFHPENGELTFVEVLLPLPLRHTYTYAATPDLAEQLAFGKRVEVPFGKKKRYAGLVVEVLSRRRGDGAFKPVLSVIDEEPVIHRQQWLFWQWLAAYYLCTPGEVMHAALPAHLKLSSETRICLREDKEVHWEELPEKEYLVARALSVQPALYLKDVQKILSQQTVYPLIHRMMQRGMLRVEEELKDSYKPRRVQAVRLQKPYGEQEELIARAFALTDRSEAQTRLLLALFDLLKRRPYVRQSELLKRAQTSRAVLKALEKKGIVEVYSHTVSRLQQYEGALEGAVALSAQQQTALKEIRQIFSEVPEGTPPRPVLLHGITGSGKTRVYIELIREALQAGQQVLYLLPEIALTTQIVQRLQKVFGDKVLVYHSRLNNNQRVELWQAVYRGEGVVLGARSALFLPFSRLGLIIVDEEHEQAYKQQDPAPRYHGRDAAVFLAHQWKARILLGSATPSLESFYNARRGKYGLVSMKERFGDAVLPRIEIISMRERNDDGPAHLSKPLIQAIQETIEAGEQVILFQNRRGYAPAMRCESCGWVQHCIQCDVSLTYHKYRSEMQCHYCGYHTKLPVHCPDCGSASLRLQGFGTEKIEDELKIYFPELRVQRMDYDSVRSRNSYARILGEFDEGQIEVLVGTQMVTKGLDFEHVGLVGIISADQLLHFPDFRATERAYQLMVQVAGRAGRKEKQGKVLIQAMNTGHPVLAEVLRYDFEHFYRRELAERRDFFYPPFSRLLRITLRHPKAERVNRAAQLFAERLKPVFRDRLMGPSVPHVGRVRGQYLIQLLVKLNQQTAQNEKIKRWLLEVSDFVRKQQGLSGVYIIFDVDPV